MFSTTSSIIAHPEVQYDFKIGSFGSTDGLFDRPVDVQVYGNYLYVSDNGNNRIQKFDLQGNFITSFGDTGTNDTRVFSPGQIAVNETTVMVADYEKSRIQVYDHDGNHLESFGGSHIISPYGIATDGKHIYVSDYLPANIKMFDMNGVWIKDISMKLNAYPIFLDVTSDYLYVTGYYYFASGVDIFDLTGNWVANMSDWASGDPVAIDQTAAAYGIHITDNRIYISDSALNRVLVTDRDGTYEAEFGTEGVANGDFSFPTGIGVSGDYVYVADYNNNRIEAFKIIPLITTTTVTNTQTVTDTEGSSNGGILSNVPFNTLYFMLGFILLVPVTRYIKRKR